MSRLKTSAGIFIECALTLTPLRWNSSLAIALNSASTPSRRPVMAISIARLNENSSAIFDFSFSSLRLATWPAACAARFCNFSRVSTSALIAPKRASISLKRLFSLSAIERASFSMVVCNADNSPSKRPRSSFNALILFMILYFVYRFLYLNMAIFKMSTSMFDCSAALISNSSSRIFTIERASASVSA